MCLGSTCGRGSVLHRCTGEYLCAALEGRTHQLSPVSLPSLGFPFGVHVLKSYHKNTHTSVNRTFHTFVLDPHPIHNIPKETIFTKTLHTATSTSFTVSSQRSRVLMHLTYTTHILSHLKKDTSEPKTESVACVCVCVCVCTLTEVTGEVMTEVSIEFGAVSFFQASAQPKVRQFDMALHTNITY